MTRRPPSQADSHVLAEGGQPGPACGLGVGRAGGVHPHMEGSGVGGTSPPVLRPVFSWVRRQLGGQAGSVTLCLWDMGPLCSQLGGVPSFGSPPEKAHSPPEQRWSHHGGIWLWGLHPSGRVKVLVFCKEQRSAPGQNPFCPFPFSSCPSPSPQGDPLGELGEWA